MAMRTRGALKSETQSAKHPLLSPSSRSGDKWMELPVNLGKQSIAGSIPNFDKTDSIEAWDRTHLSAA